MSHVSVSFLVRVTSTCGLLTGVVGWFAACHGGFIPALNREAFSSDFRKGRSIDVAVNAVDTLSTQPTHDDAATPAIFAATTPPDRTDLPSLIPRILRLNTLHPPSEELAATILDHLQGRPLHTDTDTVDDDLPLTLDEFDTEDVGTFVHSVLTRCADHDLSPRDLRTQSPTVEKLIDDELHHHEPPANPPSATS